jgi:hypothetical protein
MKWDYFIWNKHKPGDPVFAIKTLFRLNGWSFRIHKFYQADEPGCFHSHPAVAYRVILWGGYIEETEHGDKIAWRPGMFGKIVPNFVHRIHALRNGRSSVSLWIRGPITHDIETTGC